MKLTIADTIILTIAVVFISFLYQKYWFSPRQPARYAVIQIANHAPQQVSLLNSRQLKLQGYIGESLVQIDAGKIRFLAAPCRARHCIHAGWLQHSGDFAACLPNRISIELKGNEGKAFDAIVY